MSNFKILQLIVFFFFPAGMFAQEKWKTVKKIPEGAKLTELIVYHCECTGSRDLDIDSGDLVIPAGMLNAGDMVHTMDVTESKWKKKFGDYKKKGFGYMFFVRGEILSVKKGNSPKAGPAYVPLFEIYEYKIFKRKIEFKSWPYIPLEWKMEDSLFGRLPSSVHVYHTTTKIKDRPNNAYVLTAELDDKRLDFTVDTTYKRRLTPSKYYIKNDQPLLVVNTTFFSYATNQNLNVVIKDRKLLGYNIHTINGEGKDTFTYQHPFGGAFGISKKRKPDIAWVITDSSDKNAHALQFPLRSAKDSLIKWEYKREGKKFWFPYLPYGKGFKRDWNKWKIQTAVGGGPVLVQGGELNISDYEELRFPGHTKDDKHPRTAIGYTKDNKLVIMVVEGRHKGVAEGVTLEELGYMMKDMGCVEAMNLDGGGSSCMLINGKETIKVSDAVGQRPVPAVFLINTQRK